jgi:hypothetical protein
MDQKYSLMRILICLSLGLAACSSFERQPSSSAFSETDLDYFAYSPVRNVYTLNTEMASEGPYYVRGESRAYVNQIYSLIRVESEKIISQKAQSLSVEEKNIFRALALMVPHFESKLMHFRTIESIDSCKDDLQSGEVQKKSHLNLYLKHKKFLADREVLPFCSDVQNNENTFQLIASGGDARSVGIMQINLLWHPEYFQEYSFMSVRQSLEYGLNFLWQSYVDVLKQQPFCLNQKTHSERVQALLMAGWAGRYNGGKTDRACDYYGSSRTRGSIFFAQELKLFLEEHATLYDLFLEGAELREFQALRKQIEAR